MTEKRETLYIEEVIDLRELIRTLWAKKWIILGVTIMAGLVAFLVSSYLVPERYQSASFVTITEPVLRTEFETSIQANPVQLETSGLAELAEAAEFQEQVFEQLGITDLKEQQTIEVAALMQGEGQLRLQVTSEDPTLAAKAANAWAAALSERLNELYGTSQETLENLESDAARAMIDWSSAQEALETFLPESQVYALEVELSEEKRALARYLDRVEGNLLLISDVKALLSQLGLEDTGVNLGHRDYFIDHSSPAASGRGDQRHAIPGRGESDHGDRLPS